QPEYDFTVAPGADPGVISLNFQGAGQAELDGQGNLVLHTPVGDLLQHRPVAYQMIDGLRRDVASAFVVKQDGHVGFTLGDYDWTRPLTIDPSWVYSTYLGGTGSDKAA